MDEPIVITGGKDENTNVGVLIERRCYDGKDNWEDPEVRNALPRMLGALNPPRTGVVGKFLRVFDGPRRHRVVKGTFELGLNDAELNKHGPISPERERRTLKIAPDKEDKKFREHALALKSRLEHPTNPSTGKKIDLGESQKISWSIDSVALNAPHPGSPFHGVVGALNRALKHNPATGGDAYEAFFWRSGAVCVPTRVYTLPWRSGADAGIPIFRRSRLRAEGHILAVHNMLPRDMVEDIWEARLLEAKVQDHVKGHVVQHQVARINQARLASRVIPFGLDYLDKVKIARPESAYPWGYYLETDGVGVIRTVEKTESMLLQGVDLDWLEQVSSPANVHKFGAPILSYGEERVETARPVDELVLPEVARVPAVTSLREVEAWELQKAAVG